MNEILGEVIKAENMKKKTLTDINCRVKQTSSSVVS